LVTLIEKGRSSQEHRHPLLFVHGAFQGGWVWDEHFLDFFAERGFRTLALSLRGHGASAATKPLRLCSISDYVDDIASIADALTPWPILVGHSMGGFVVQRYLDDNPAPAAVLLASAPPRGHPRTLLALLRQRPWNASRFALSGRPADLYRGAAADARAFFFGDEAPDGLVASAVERFQPESTRALVVDMGLGALFRKSRIAAPVLVIGAEQDALYPPRDVHATAAYYGTEPIIIPNIGHEVMLEPGWPKVAECILSWLDQRGL
jgi:pimeloyl-ACP methyl ester carboxylesterase